MELALPQQSFGEGATSYEGCVLESVGTWLAPGAHGKSSRATATAQLVVRRAIGAEFLAAEAAEAADPAAMQSRVAVDQQRNRSCIYVCVRKA